MDGRTDKVAWHFSDEAARQIAYGEHDDPFSILGPHQDENGTVLVAFDPGAETLSAISDTTEKPLSPIPGAPGVFSGRIEDGRSYRLKGSGYGENWDYEDAYRFGPVLGDLDEHLISEGSHKRLWTVLGAHVMVHEGMAGTHFAVWAPNARQVSVTGDFNQWNPARHVMRRRGSTGVWEIFIPELGDGTPYKYCITGKDGLRQPLKADPLGFGSQHPPETASIVRDISGYGWPDKDWMETRADRNGIHAPISIFEVHLPSWRRRFNEGGRALSYKEAAEELVSYAHDMGFTHIELMPVHEYPFEGSWGYQPVGLYAPTIRHGPPHEFRDLIAAAHKKGMGLIIDWVPGHFPSDAHGLANFDGTALYEYADPKEGFHQDWNTLIYNYGRNEVANYLISNALYWLEEYHIDGLRVDAVASMLYRDYSRQEGEWIPNKNGGRENLEAIDLFRRLNTAVYADVDGIMTIAEESTSFPGVSHPVNHNGLGFGYKWNMGWMNDTLSYMAQDPVHRKYHHDKMTFGLHYAFSENFILPLSHDEVVHGKGSMLARMPGNDWEKFANLRSYYGFMWGHPGKKLIFMGSEFAQPHEWNHDAEVDWGAVAHPLHAGVQRLVRDLNTLYRGIDALHSKDCDSSGFQWLVVDDADQSVFAWVRRGVGNKTDVIVVCNMTPVERSHWRCGLTRAGAWTEIMNTDAEIYGGGNRGNLGTIEAEAIPYSGQAFSAEITLPPLTTLFFESEQII